VERDVHAPSEHHRRQVVAVGYAQWCVHPRTKWGLAAWMFCIVLLIVLQP